ncbi:MAG: GAF domain-containing protein, partial [Anaerolineae bacterium]|nr:GAF domain-containing protein [Anaerolineae bacterium]
MQRRNKLMLVSQSVDMNIAQIRYRIMWVVTFAVLIGFLILSVINPIILGVSDQSVRVMHINFLIFTPALLVFLITFTYFYLRPIDKLAAFIKAGGAIPRDVAQESRTLAFEAPLRFLYIPTLSAFIVAILSDIWGVLFVDNYIFMRHFPGTILVTVAAAVVSLSISIIVRRLLVPVLILTSSIAEDIGPRFDIRSRQFVMTFILTFIAVAFLTVLGYALVSDTKLENLRTQYQLLGNVIAQDVASYISEPAIIEYVETLSVREGIFVIVIDDTGRYVSIPPAVVDFDLPPESLLQETFVTAIENSYDLIPLESVEIFLVPLADMSLVDTTAKHPQRWLCFVYPVNPWLDQEVRQSLIILAIFVGGLTLFIFIATHYLSEDLLRDLKYVTSRLSELSKTQQNGFQTVNVLSLDEVGDLVLEFNKLQDQIYQQKRQMELERTQLVTLQRISHQIGTILDIDELLQAIISIVEGAFGYRNTSIFLIDEHKQELYIAAHPVYFSKTFTGARFKIGRAEGVRGRVAATGQPILLSDTRECNYYTAFDPAIRSELAVPMVVNNQVIGVFNVESEQLDAFAQHDVQVVTALANQAAIAIHNAQLYKEVEDKRQSSAILAEMSQLVNSTLELDQVFDLALENLGQLVPCDSSSILLAKGSELTIVAGRGFDKPDAVIGKSFVPDEANLGYEVMQSRQARLVHDVQSLRSWGHDRDDIEGAHVIRAWIGVPLIVHGQSIGLLTVDKHEPDFYTQDDMHKVIAFANVVSTAVQNARLYQTMLSRAQELSLLHEVSQQISALLDVDKLLEEIVNRVAEVFDYQVVSVYLVDAEQRTLRFVVQSGLQESFAVDPRTSLDDPGVVPWVARHGKYALVKDVTQDERYVELFEGIRSELAIPLMVGDRVVGVFNLESDQSNAFDYDDVRLMSALGHQISVALENAHLFESVSQQATDLERIQQVSQRISSILNINQVLDTLSQAIVETFDYSYFSILLVDEKASELYVGALHGYPDDFAGERLKLYGDSGIVALAAATCRPVNIPDVTQESRYVAWSEAVRSELAIPLLLGEQVIGVFNIEAEVPNAFKEEDVRLMTILAQQITAALENARLFENVHNQALELAGMAGDLADEKRRLGAILYNIADGLLVTDPKGTILRVNPAFERMFGMLAPELVGKPLPSVIGNRELQRLILNATTDAKSTFTVEIPMSDGRTLKASSAAIQEEIPLTIDAPVMDLQHDTRLLGAVTVMRDITYDKEMDRMKTEFISSISHELRTPLTSVLGFAKLIGKTLERDIVPELTDNGSRKSRRAVRRIEDNLDIIVKEGERLTHLINDVLDISKMEVGKIQWNDQPFDIVTAIQEVVADNQAVVAEHKLQLLLEVGEKIPPVVADPERIKQVLANLLSNAIKFTEQGKITLAARFLSPEEEVHGWRASVEQGGGIL